MATATNTTTNRRQTKEKKHSIINTIIFFPITITLKIITGAMMGICFAILIEWIGMTWIWPNNPDHAKEMLANELTYMGENFQTSVLGTKPSVLIDKSVTFVYQKLFDNNLVEKSNAIINQPASSKLLSAIKSFLMNMQNYFSAAAYITLVTILRIIIFLLSAPWFILCGIIGCIDGLVERQIRADEHGLEHGLVHHIARRHMGWAFLASHIFYLSIPFTINPIWILIPAGVLFGGNLFLITSTFKKHL